MKNYRKLMPVVLILLFVLGIYMMWDSNLSVETEYNNNLRLAREYAEQDIPMLARQHYLKALDIRSSVELYLEIGQYYLNSEQNGYALAWADRFTQDYPKETKAYEYAIDTAVKLRDIIGAFKYYDVVKNKQLSNEKIEEIISTIEYEYRMSRSYHEVGAFCGNFCQIKEGSVWGYADNLAQEVISPKYLYAGPFVSNKAAVVDLDGDAYYIDTNGNVLERIKIEESIQKLGLMDGTVYSIYNGEVWNVYDKEKGFLFGGFTESSVISGGIFVAQKDGKWNLYNTSGEAKMSESYDAILMDDRGVAYRNDRLMVKAGDVYKMIDINGQQIGTETYEDAKAFNDNTYVAVKKNGKWGFVDKEGAWVIEPQYDDARSFSNGLAAVCMDEKWGFVNTKKKIAIDYQYSGAKDFNSNGVVFVEIYGEWNALILFQKNY